MRFTLRRVRSMTTSPAHLFPCSKWIASAASVFLAIIPGHSLSAEEPDQKLVALHAISTLDQRVATLAHQLAIAGVSLCPISTPVSGFSVHHLSQYSVQFRNAARTHFALDQRVQVLSVAADGPADRAGLKPGDVVEQVNGTPLPVLTVGKSAASAAFVEDIAEILAAESTLPIVRLRIARGGERKVLRLKPELGCQGNVSVKPANELNAYADGAKIVITTAIVRLARNDDELAAVLAHEFAHTNLGHRRLLNKKGRSRALIQSTEYEADRFSIHLLKAAGFDPIAALHFWKRYGPKQGGLFSDSGHPGWRSRVNLMAAEVEALGTESAPY